MIEKSTVLLLLSYCGGWLESLMFPKPHDDACTGAGELLNWRRKFNEHRFGLKNNESERTMKFDNIYLHRLVVVAAVETVVAAASVVVVVEVVIVVVVVVVVVVVAVVVMVVVVVVIVV
ncbi:hypothetical protein ElyMa_003930900 [Elysia marginata]|uniref:Uncharacterized protein n=1 Tax=Elysia marginata TaxID=1093978 RepID=A0AAV4FT11_9GAST|nr:hypothetical protein ElyMa_003930900 [Elysia marginata]